MIKVVIAVCVFFGTVVTGVAQQSAPSPITRFIQDYANRHGAAQPVNKAVPLVPNRVAPRIVQGHQVCAIPLQSVPIDKTKNFSIQQNVPKETDSRSIIKPSAPSCAEASR